MYMLVYEIDKNADFRFLEASDRTIVHYDKTFLNAFPVFCVFFSLAKKFLKALQNTL